MKKRNVFNYSIYLLLLLFFPFFSCENEEVIAELKAVELEYSLKKITTKELVESNSKILEIANKYNNPLKKNNAELTQKSELNDFTVLTEEIVYLEAGDYNSYTFSITRDDNDFEGFENLLISKQKDNSYRAILIRYNVTLDEKRRISEGELIDYKNKVDFLDIDFEIESLLSSRGQGGNLSVCPPDACCITVVGISDATGAAILTQKIVDCEEDSDIDSGGGGGGGGTGNPSDGGPTGNEGNGGSGGGSGSGSPSGGGDRTDDGLCLDCNEDGTTPITPELLEARSQLNDLVESGFIEGYEFFSTPLNSDIPQVESIEELIELVMSDINSLDFENATSNITVSQNLHTTEYSVAGVGLIFNFEIQQELDNIQLDQNYRVTNVNSFLSGVAIATEWNLIDADNIPEKVIIKRRLDFEAEVPIKGIYRQQIGFEGFSIRLDVPIEFTFLLSTPTGTVKDVKFTFF